jgi:sRNA-binding protein
VGVDKDIRATVPGMTHRLVGDALALHTRHHSYLAAVATEGAMRVDLGGVAVEPVSDRDRAHAADALARLQAKRKGRERRAEPDDGFHLTEIDDVEADKRNLRDKGYLFNVKVRRHEEPESD